MRIEQFPLLLGVLVALVGLTILLDAWQAGGVAPLRERRRRARAVPNKAGQTLVALGTMCMAAALHFDLAIHNFGIQEHMPHTAETDQVFPHSYRFESGLMHPGEASGLGVDIDESLAANWPYQRAYLPVNRMLDGTIHSW
jgi:mannonate dehydratase